MTHQYLTKIKDPADLKALNTQQREQLALEIRNYITEVVAKNGGHLASNLGVVELTMALHVAFDMPTDQIVFDVSHQAYVHKILTGRMSQFRTLRQHGGMSGFTKRHESTYDILEAGHASTSLSAALGLAKARDIKGEDFNIVAVIGDGAMSGGLAYEGLNNIGHEKSKLIIILNDNEMSISENVGSLTTYLANLRTNPNYYKVKEEAHHYIEKIPALGKVITKSISKLKDSIKQFLVPGMLFEELGITYIGVIDGHDTERLIETFNRAKNVDGPVLIHIKTVKGKGYTPAEQHPERFHGIDAFDIATGQSLKSSPTKSFSSVFSEAIVDIAQEDRRICAITAAMPSGTGLASFATAFPDRFFDVGIAEGHAVTFAAGLAINGLKPFFAVYSTFLQRGYDQLIHDICIQDLPVTFCVDRAGLVGNDGETHHGVFDLSYLLSVPNLHVMVPKDGTDLRTMIALAKNYPHPLAIRYPRGNAYSDSTDYQMSLNCEVNFFGDAFTIIAIGRMHHIALEALEELHLNGISGKLITPKQIKPLNINAIATQIVGDKLFTLEDNSIIGGFGAYFNQQLHVAKLPISIDNWGIDDSFVTHGSVAELFAKLRLDPRGIVQRIREAFNDG